MTSGAKSSLWLRGGEPVKELPKEWREWTTEALGQGVRIEGSSSTSSLTLEAMGWPGDGDETIGQTQGSVGAHRLEPARTYRNLRGASLPSMWAWDHH